MYIMTQDGWRPLRDHSAYWAAKHARTAECREAIAALQHFKSTEKGLDDMERAGRNRIANMTYERLFAALDAQLGYAPKQRRNFVTTL